MVETMKGRPIRYLQYIIFISMAVPQIVNQEVRYMFFVVWFLWFILLELQDIKDEMKRGKNITINTHLHNRSKTPLVLDRSKEPVF